MNLGCEVTVLTAVPRWMSPIDRIPGVTVHAVRLADLSGLLRAQVGVAPQVVPKAREIASLIRPHVLFAHGLHFQSSIAAAMLQQSTRLPLVTASHTAELDHLHQPIRTFTALYEATIGRYILRRSARVIASSDSVSQHLLSLGVPPSRIEHVAYGVDVERFRPRSQPTSTPEAPLVMFVGRQIPNKGPQVLLDALLRLNREGIGFRADFLSDGPLRTTLDKRANDNGLANSVRFTGYVPDVAARMSQADIIVRPSFTEGMPLSLIEAMASGVCVVASNIGGNSDLVRNGDNGMLFTAGDSLELAGILRKLIQDPVLRRRLAKAGYETAQTYSWEKCANETARVLLDASQVPSDARMIGS